MENQTNQVRQKLTLTAEEARELIWKSNKDYKTIEKKIIDTTRWSIVTEIVIQRISDGKFFSDVYSEGATESQDESPFEYSEPDFTEVFPVEKTIIVYE